MKTGCYYKHLDSSRCYFVQTNTVKRIEETLCLYSQEKCKLKDIREVDKIK